MSDTHEEHFLRLKKVLDVIAESRITLNEFKCKFGFHRLDYLSVNVSGSRVNVTETRIKEVKC